MIIALLWSRSSILQTNLDLKNRNKTYAPMLWTQCR